MSKILIIDDEEQTRVLFKMHLDKYSTIEVIEAVDGHKGFVLSIAHGVYSSGHHFFAHTGLTQNKDGRVDFGTSKDKFKDLLHGAANADHLCLKLAPPHLPLDPR